MSKRRPLWTRGWLAAFGLAHFGCGTSKVAPESFGESSSDDGAPYADVRLAEGTALPNRFPCVAPVSLTIAPSGYYRCDNGMVHRALVRACPSSGDHLDPGPSESPELDECTSDRDCTERPHGFCGRHGGPSRGNSCLYGCLMDADCGAGSICLCGIDSVPSLTNPAPVATCVPAECRSDSDCHPGFHCALYDASAGCFSQAFSCQRSSDECGGSNDCAVGQLCTLESRDGNGATSSARRCIEPSCDPLKARE